MLSLDKTLELTILAITFFLFGLIVQKFLTKKEKEDYKKTYKEMVENFVSLNVTHLHDSANLFNLIKNGSTEQNIVNFATGSAYHFRSIFNSLKKSIIQIREFDPDEVNNLTLYKLIEKEDIDLKDLINIELFQLGNFSQIEVIDYTSSQYALTYGNFELLSKVFLNLVENALKYSDQKIKISLNDENNMFTIRIMSFGRSISEHISLRINNKIYDDIEGHGLSSLVDIMNYHDANIHITSLPNEGSSVNLEFKKISQSNKKPLQIEKLKAPKKQEKLVWALSTSLVLCIGLYLIIKVQSQQTRSIKVEKCFTPQTKLETQASPVKNMTKAPSSKPKNIAKNTHQKTKAQNTDEVFLNDLIDNETQKLGLDMDL
jgi:hypothetical protein